MENYYKVPDFIDHSLIHSFKTDIDLEGSGDVSEVYEDIGFKVHINYLSEASDGFRDYTIDVYQNEKRQSIVAIWCPSGEILETFCSCSIIKFECIERAVSILKNLIDIEINTIKIGKLLNL